MVKTTRKSPTQLEKHITGIFIVIAGIFGRSFYQSILFQPRWCGPTRWVIDKACCHWFSSMKYIRPRRTELVHQFGRRLVRNYRGPSSESVQEVDSPPRPPSTFVHLSEIIMVSRPNPSRTWIFEEAWYILFGPYEIHGPWYLKSYQKTILRNLNYHRCPIFCFLIASFQLAWTIHQEWHIRCMTVTALNKIEFHDFSDLHLIWTISYDPWRSWRYGPYGGFENIPKWIVMKTKKFIISENFWWTLNKFAEFIFLKMHHNSCLIQ